MAAKTKLLTPTGWSAVILLTTTLIILIGLTAWPRLNGFMAQDACLDAGGSWNGRACISARLG